MDAGGTSKRDRPGRRPKMPPKLKFKPKVPVRKVKKSTAEKPQLEETQPIDEELMKRLRTGQGDAKTLPVIKDENSAAQDSHPMPSSAAGFSLPLTQSGGQKQVQPKKALQIPRSFPVVVNPGKFESLLVRTILPKHCTRKIHGNDQLVLEMFYDDEDEEDDDEDEDNVELQENQPSSSECESSIHPAKELNLLEQNDKIRMFLFKLPKYLPLPRISSTVVQRNGKAIIKETKEGHTLNDLPGGYMGKMLVYKSGKIKMKLGDAMFDVNSGTECGMSQHAVAINTREKHCCPLGEIENRHVVVTPDVDSLLNDNRD